MFRIDRDPLRVGCAANEGWIYFDRFFTFELCLPDRPFTVDGTEFVPAAGAGPVDVAIAEGNVARFGGDLFFDFFEDTGGNFSFKFEEHRGDRDEVFFDRCPVEVGSPNRAQGWVGPVDMVAIDGDTDPLFGDEVGGFDRAAGEVVPFDSREGLFGAGVGIVGELLVRGEEDFFAILTCGLEGDRLGAG